MRPNYFCSHPQSGFTLIEVMVSLIVLSAGVYGVLTMQMISIQTTQQTNYFRTALMAATELSDKMLGNAQQDDAVPNPFLKINYQATSDHRPSANSCTDRDCSPVQLADAEIADWLERISATLPDARAVVCRDDQPWNAQKSRLTWDCQAAGEHSATIIKLGWTDKGAQADITAPPKLAIPAGSVNHSNQAR